MSSESSFSFSTTRKFIQLQFIEDLRHSIAWKPTVFETSNTDVNYSTAGTKTYTMIRDPEDPRLIISMPKLLHAWRGNCSFRRTRWPRPWTCRPQPERDASSRRDPPFQVQTSSYWMIEYIIIKTLTKLQKKSPSDCQDKSQKTGETEQI
jgi:hypothetical protein